MFVYYRSFHRFSDLTRLYILRETVKWLKALILKGLAKSGRKSPMQRIVTKV